MSELEEKLNSLLSNPQLMQQIASMAQSMSSAAPAPQAETRPSQTLPNTDTPNLQGIFQVANQAGVDHNQQALLHALSPYLSSSRIQKLERAMRAAKMADLASLFLNSGGLQMITGR